MTNRMQKTIAALFTIGAAVAMAQDNIVFDDFGNGDLATGGAGTTNAGFIKATSGGTATETNGVAIVTATAKNTTCGLVSLNSFNAAVGGFTAVWVVPTLPLGGNYGTLNFTLQSGSGLYSDNKALSFAVKYVTGGSTFTVDAFNGTKATLQSGSSTAGANDGFTLTATVNEAGWAFESTKLGMYANGSWTNGYAYADLFDDSTHVGGFINRGGVASNKELRLNSVTVLGAPVPVAPARIIGIEPVGDNLVRLIISAPGSAAMDP